MTTSDPYVQPPIPPQPPLQQPLRLTSGKAVASLVTALLGLGIVPVILGHMARKEIKATGKDGDGLALAGLILGYIQVAFYSIILIMMLATIGATNDFSPSQVSDSTIETLHDGCAGGDMGDCNELYEVTPIGSAEESFGSTCGGRQIETYGNC